MNREDVIRMAREARLDVYGIGSNHDTFMLIQKNFANLVARQERKRISQKIEQLQRRHYLHGTRGSFRYLWNWK